MRSFVFISVLLAGCTCTSPQALEVDAGACGCPSPASSPSWSGTTPKTPSRQEPTTDSPHLHPLAVCDGRGKLPLDAAQEAFDAHEYEKALSCAAQAAALSPSDVIAQTERANALAQLNRFDEAVLAYARALAIDPDSLDALAGAAHFYTVLMPSSRELDELGSAYAERGFELSTSQKDEVFAVTFARLSARAFNDIGQPQDALDRADWVLALEAEAVEPGLLLCRVPSDALPSGIGVGAWVTASFRPSEALVFEPGGRRLAARLHRLGSAACVPSGAG